jgi:hypothetical protein
MERRAEENSSRDPAITSHRPARHRRGGQTVSLVSTLTPGPIVDDTVTALR